VADLLIDPRSNRQLLERLPRPMDTDDGAI
jgi:hypothetical protein